MMKYVGLILNLTFVFSAIAQDTSFVKRPLSGSGDVIKKVNVINNPGINDLYHIYQNIGSRYSKDDAINAIAEQKDSVIPSLEQLLFTTKFIDQRISTPDSGEAFEVRVPQMILAVKTLELIGTENAYHTLIKTAKAHRSAYVRSFALQSVASSLHEKVKAEKVIPNRDVIDLLIQNCNDDTFIGEHQKTIKQIADDGLTQWIGFTFSDPKFDEEIKALRLLNPSLTHKDFGKKWLRENEPKIAWNKETGHFEVKK